MADKISSYVRSGIDISNARNRQVNKSPGPDDTQTRNRPEPARDGVDFSDTVTNLQRIERQLKDTSEVDSARVAEVRARLDAGEFEVDADRVAEKLARLEQDLS